MLISSYSWKYETGTLITFLFIQMVHGMEDDWNGAVASKLHYVKPVLGDWQSSYGRCRKDEVILFRARIGHTHFTHSYILRKYPPPQCEQCQCIPTVCHILVECNHFARERKDIFGRRDVVESFRFHPTLILTVIFYLLHSSLCFIILYIFLKLYYITISCVYLFLTPNSQSVFRAGVSLNNH